MDKEILLTSAVVVLTSIIASSGFWAFLQMRGSRKSAEVQLLLGLAHDRIIYLGMQYVDRGYVSKDEYEDYVKYLYAPYSKFGGNGLAERVMRLVDQLPMRRPEPLVQVTEEKR